MCGLWSGGVAESGLLHVGLQSHDMEEERYGIGGSSITPSTNTG